MRYDTSPDLPFLADSLADLGRLGYRQMVNDKRVFEACLQRLVNREYVWVTEKPDTWRDAVSMAFGPLECDCEDLAALVIAILLYLYGFARAGIRQVSDVLCHAIAGDDKKGAIDVCPEMGMPGSSSGPVEWRELREKPMLDAVGGIFVEGFKALVGTSRENPATGGTSDEDIDIGADGLDYFLNLVIPFLGAEEAEKLRNAKRKMEKQIKEYGAKVKRLNKELADAKALAATKAKEADAAKKRCDAAIAEAKKAAQTHGKTAAAESKGRISAEQGKAAAEALVKELRRQLEIIQSRPTDDDGRARLATVSTLLENNPVDTLAAEFADNPEALFGMWEMAGVTGAYIRDTACCAACGEGHECETACKDGECHGGTGEHTDHDAPEIHDVGGPSVLDAYELFPVAIDYEPVGPRYIGNGGGCGTCQG